MNRQSSFDTGYMMLQAGALEWPREMIWGGKREGGFRFGNSCTPMADSHQCMAKPIQYCKVKFLKNKKRVYSKYGCECVNVGFFFPERKF